MNKKNIILAGTLLFLLGSASHAYGYWMNQLESDWTIPVAYPVTISIIYEEEEESLPVSAAKDSAQTDEADSSGSNVLETNTGNPAEIESAVLDETDSIDLDETEDAQ